MLKFPLVLKKSVIRLTPLKKSFSRYRFPSLRGIPYNVRESKIVLDSGLHAVDSRFSVSGTWIPGSSPVVSGVPDSLSCIPGSQ